MAHLLQVLGVPLTGIGAASLDGHRIGREALRRTHIGHSSAIDVGIDAAYALIRSGDVDEQLDDVLSRFAPRLAPWTQCLRCGALLEEVPAAEVAAQLEPGTARTYRSFSRCTGCDRVYWRGAHSPRLEALVRRATGDEPGARGT